MTILTVTGMMGAGGPQLSEELSHLTGMDMVDRLVLAEAARRLGSTPEALEIKTEQPPKLWDRIAQSIRKAMVSTEVTHDFTESGLDLLAGEEYRDLVLGLDPAEAELRNATESAIRDMAQSGNIIFNGRAAHMALRDHPSAVHVSTTSNVRRRVERVMERLLLSREEAERYVGENDKARAHYYRSFYDADPTDPSLFHLVLNLDVLSIGEAARVVLATAQEITGRSAPTLDEQP